MTHPKIIRLGDLQLRIMQVLWERGESTVTEVIDHLPAGSDLAYTTVATMLRKMETRDLVAHRNEGRTFVYRPNIAAQAVTRSMADHLVDRLFEGSLTDVVTYLLTTREVSRAELGRLEKLIADRKKSL
jgi:BlaI family penicillinase repressor